MYLHVVEPKTQTIAPIPHVLKVIDAKYDFLKHYYTGFAIENVVVSSIALINCDTKSRCLISCSFISCAQSASTRQENQM